jgi:hypothetical protein
VHRHLLLLHVELLHLMLMQPGHCHHGRRGGGRARHWTHTGSHLCLLELAPFLCLNRLFTPVVIRHAVHAHNDTWEISSFGYRILDKRYFHFVHGAAMQPQRTPCLHALMARVALEMARTLMLDENALKQGEMKCLKSTIEYLK